ncbi:MAG TPA: ABC transporter permease [Candidatus Bathyarchaeota archaeon]|nr:ABC transporter permease [Candidatus Bathyarchaeota archaeon]
MGARTLISNSLRIAWKDLMELFRNRMGLVLLILMPIFMMVMVGFIYPSETSMKNVPIALVNEDAGFGGYNLSSTFITMLSRINDNASMMTLKDASSLEDVRGMIQAGDAEGGIIVSSDFTADIMGGQQGTITIVTDQSNPQMSAIIQAVLSEVFKQMGTALAQQNVAEQLNLDPSKALAVVEPFNVQVKGSVEGDFSYFDFIAPGIMAMTVMMSVMTGLPAAISHEREVGTLDGIMVAPINRLSVILGKTIAQMARGILQGVLILVLAMVLFGVTVHGNILLVFVLLLLGVFSFVGLGVVLTSFAKEQETAVMLMTTITFPMLFLSGVFFPIEQMPWFMQAVSKALPLTYVADALRKVMVLGADIPMLTNELAILIGFGTVMILIAVPVFKRAMTR